MTKKLKGKMTWEYSQNIIILLGAQIICLMHKGTPGS